MDTRPEPEGARPTPPAETPRTPVTPRVPALALLPLRLFLGVTYLYAGIDKFASQHFLVAGDPFSVAAQLEGYARTSPLAALITAAMPAAIGIGFLIALAELAIGLGLLTGLAYRLSAWSGAALSLLFWLTASWSSTPYFFSPDLPYLAGFVTLALAGHGGRLLLTGLRRGTQPVATPGKEPMLARRSILQVGALAAITAVAAVVSAQLRALGAAPANAAGTGSRATPTPAPTSAPATATPAPTEVAAVATPATDPTAAATAAPTAPPTAAPTAAATPTGPVIGSLAELGDRNGRAFTVPFEAPTELMPGSPGILVELPDGSVVAYSAICTHGRCTVGFDATSGLIQCPCHLARFDPANQAAVLGGPAQGPLPSIPVLVDPATGKVHANLPA